MTSAMTGQEKDDLLIQVTAQASLNLLYFVFREREKKEEYSILCTIAAIHLC